MIVRRCSIVNVRYTSVCRLLPGRHCFQEICKVDFTSTEALPQKSRKRSRKSFGSCLVRVISWIVPLSRKTRTKSHEPTRNSLPAESTFEAKRSRISKPPHLDDKLKCIEHLRLCVLFCPQADQRRATGRAGSQQNSHVRLLVNQEG